MLINYWTPNFNIDFIIKLNLTPYSKSTLMNYPIAHFSKRLYNFLMSYGYILICATCATYEQVAGTHIDK